MKLRSAIIAGIILAFGTAGSAVAQIKPPYEIVRSVQALHDQMALGSRAAQEALPGLLRRLAGRLVAVPASAWADPRNTRAVIVYILSGGEIRVAEKVLESHKCAPLEKRLIQGALAYLEGDRADAKSLLDSVDVRTLEPAVGSHVALAQAALIAQDSPARAIAILDVARVLAPGTLIEDTALRREVFLAEQSGNFDKFVSMAQEYLLRFRHSVYAESFRRSLSAAIVQMALLGNASQRKALVELVSGMSPHEQLRLYLNIAQAAITKGKIGSARWASDKALPLADKNSLQAHRALLYDGAASILTSDYDRGLAELKGLKADRLPHADAMLAAAAISVAQQIRKWPQSQEAPPANQDAFAAGSMPKLPRPPADTKDALPAALAATINTDDATIAQAQQMLAESSALLKNVQ